jgi:predicted ATPase
MKTLREFIHSFDFIRMKPDRSIVQAGLLEKATAYALAEPGRQYALYIFGGRQAQLTLEIAAGDYQVRWWNPTTGKVDEAARLQHTGGSVTLTPPAWSPDIALQLVTARPRR